MTVCAAVRSLIDHVVSCDLRLIDMLFCVDVFQSR